jgi:hypothetical protein
VEEAIEGILVACGEVDRRINVHPSDAQLTLLMDAFSAFMMETCGLWADLAAQEFYRTSHCMPHCPCAMNYLFSFAWSIVLLS